MTLAFVTGGNRGIGLEVCASLARKGVRVLLGSRDEGLGERAAGELQAEGLEIFPILIDLSDRNSIERAAQEILDVYGAPDILVNNAAVLPEGSILEVADEKLVEGIGVNVMGPIYLTRALLPEMIEQGGGRIVNISSGWGSFAEGLLGPAVYSISKAALNAFTVTTAQSVPECIRINSVTPGWVRTRMGGVDAPRSVQEGADTIIWLAMLDEDGPTGKFFRDREEIDW